MFISIIVKFTYQRQGLIIISQIPLLPIRNVNKYIDSEMEIIADKVQALLPSKKINVFGKDQLLHHTFPYYLLAALMSIGIVYGIQSGFVLIFIAYTLLPLVDEFFSLDLRNPSEEERKKLQERDIYFKLALYATIVVDWILFFRSMKMFQDFQFSVPNFINLAAFIFIFSNLNAVQFAVAHEIFHKNGLFNKYLGTIHMVKNLYMHFTYQHLYGHHRRVATPEDPASAEKGISLYKFFPRTFFGSYKSVYEMEIQQKKPFYTNYAVLSIIASILFTLLMFKIYGMQAGILFLVEAFGSIFYLEAINYLQHYGLRRQKKADGSYEKVTIRHSWNAPHRFSNYLLFKLQRHSDHHQNSLKPYQTLVSLQQSPHLPHGYSVCIFMSLFPSAWFKIMDPLVDEYNNTKKGNIDGQVMMKAVKETRRFIIRLGLAITSGLVLSRALMM